MRLRWRYDEKWDTIVMAVFWLVMFGAVVNYDGPDWVKVMAGVSVNVWAAAGLVIAELRGRGK